MEVPGFTLALDEPADIALTKLGGEWRGVWQTPDMDRDVPAPLRELTTHWVKLRGIAARRPMPTHICAPRGDVV